MDARNSTVRKPILVAAILLVAMAVTLVVLHSWVERPRVEDNYEPAVVAVDEGPIAPLEEPSVEPSAAIEPQAVVAVARVAPREPVRVILLPVRSKNRDPSAEAFLHRVRESMLRALYGMGIEVIDVGAAEYAAIVPPNAGALPDDNLAYLAVKHRYGALNVAEVFEESSPDDSSWLVQLAVVRGTGTSRTGNPVRKNGDPNPENAPESLGIQFAETLSRNTTRESFALRGAEAAPLILLDPTRSDQERLRALYLLESVGLDSTTLAAAVDLGSRSASANTRRAVWANLSSSFYDPMLAQPLSYALLSDPDPGVRAEAALALGAYLRDPGARSALEQARRNDYSPDVKLAARMSMLDFEERKTFTRATLLDRSLPAAERFAPTLLTGTVEANLDNSYGSAAAEEALAYAEIAAGIDDPGLKVLALNSLRVASTSAGLGVVRPDQRVDPTITRVLIESVRHENYNVRRAALNGLVGQYATARARPSQLTDPDNLEIRAVLETVMREEPALANDLNIEQTLRPPAPAAVPRTFPPPRNIGRAPP